MIPKTASSPPMPRANQIPERRNPSLAELAAEQGVAGPQNFDALLGSGADLWDDDADFEAFQTGLDASRRTGG